MSEECKADKLTVGELIDTLSKYHRSDPVVLTTDIGEWTPIRKVTRCGSNGTVEVN